MIPFSLTKDQEETLNEIVKDFNSFKRMNRLVMGDVGCGKTIVAFYSSYFKSRMRVSKRYFSSYRSISSSTL